MKNPIKVYIETKKVWPSHTMSFKSINQRYDRRLAHPLNHRAHREDFEL